MVPATTANAFGRTRALCVGGCDCVFVFSLCFCHFALSLGGFGAGAFMVPPEGYSHGPPAPDALFREKGELPET